MASKGSEETGSGSKRMLRNGELAFTRDVCLLIAGMFLTFELQDVNQYLLITFPPLNDSYYVTLGIGCIAFAVFFVWMAARYVTAEAYRS